MALQKMFVSATQRDGNNDAQFPYEFYAKKTVEDTQTYVIHLVMPLGGKENGLFRYPKDGEAILVDDDGGSTPTYYLLGYLPSEGDVNSNFLTNLKERDKPETPAFQQEKQALKDEEALVLRYEQTGKASLETDDDRYSEIGFYHRQTQWRSSNPSYKDLADKPLRTEEETDAAYSARLVKAGCPKEAEESDADHIKRVTTVFPQIDQVNIQSTGDMYASAQNHQRLKAKRFELLVDCNDTIHTKAELEKDELPLGDNVGDDSVLHAGDAHIRAARRVVIKAEEEILLQVGKTALKISDDALDVISKIVNSNFTNAYDATLTISKDGISMFGREVNITADKSFGLGDAFGGSIGGELGVVSIGGREIKAEVYDSVQYALLVTYATAQYIQSITSGSMAVNGNVSNTQIADYVKFSFDTLKDGSELIKNIYDVVKEWKERADEKAKRADEEAIEQGRYADAEAKKKNEEITNEANEIKQKADNDAKEKNAQIDRDLADNKCTQAEADQRKADVDADTAKKKADAEADAKIKKAEVEAEKQKIKADADAAKTKKEVDENAAKTKKEADENAAKTKEKADENAAEEMKKIDKDVDEGKMTREEATTAREAVDNQAKQEKEAADNQAQTKKDAADTEAAQKTKAAEEEAKTKTKAAEEEAKTKKQAATDEANAKKTAATDEAKMKKDTANAEAKKKKDAANAEAKKKKDAADAADAAAKSSKPKTP